METKPKKNVFSLGAAKDFASIDDGCIKTLSSMALASGKVLESAGEIYLRTLIHRFKVRITPGSGNDLVVLNLVEGPMYAAVKAGALTDDITWNKAIHDRETKKAFALEHNKRCNWARTIKSELKGAIKAGVNLLDVDPKVVTKRTLREMKLKCIEKAAGVAMRPTNEELACLSMGKAIGYINKQKTKPSPAFIGVVDSFNKAIKRRMKDDE